MRITWKVILATLALVLVVVLALSSTSISLASSGDEKFDYGTVGTHTEGWVTITIAGHEPTYVSGGYITAPEGCTVSGGTVFVKGGKGTTSQSFTGSSFSGPIYAPVNNGGNVADVSHVTVVYYYTCSTPTPPVDTPTPTPSDPGETPTPPVDTPTPTPSDPGETPTPTPSDPGETPTPTPTNPATPTPTPRITEPPIPGRG